MKRIDCDNWTALRANLCARFGGACAYCRRVVGMRGTVDHWLPQALGGSNEFANLRWCCLACNRAKGAMTPQEWAVAQPLLRPALESRASTRVRLLQAVAARTRVWLQATGRGRVTQGDARE
jgi:5-methylcytosine-specific restriction endonuclease McrA